MRSFVMKAQLKRSLTWALLFQVVWFGTAIIAETFGFSVSFGLLILMSIVLWVPAILELITHTYFPLSLQLHFFVFITISSIMGSAFHIYGIVSHWDLVAHFDSGILLGWLALFVVRRVEERTYAPLPKWFAILTALMTPLAFAAVWEICEFMSDRFLHTATQAGLQDTIYDMASAGIGGIVAILLIVWTYKPVSVLPKALRSRRK